MASETMTDYQVVVVARQVWSWWGIGDSVGEKEIQCSKQNVKCEASTEVSSFSTFPSPSDEVFIYAGTFFVDIFFGRGIIISGGISAFWLSLVIWVLWSTDVEVENGHFNSGEVELIFLSVLAICWWWSRLLEIFYRDKEDDDDDGAL